MDAGEIKVKTIDGGLAVFPPLNQIKIQSVIPAGADHYVVIVKKLQLAEAEGSQRNLCEICQSQIQ